MTDREFKEQQYYTLVPAVFQKRLKKYTGELVEGIHTLETVEMDMQAKDIHPKVIEKMINSLKKSAIPQREDLLDIRLFNVMQALNDATEKWTITNANEVVTTFPHPVLDSEGKLLGIEFKPYKYILDTMLPPALAERYTALQRAIKQAKKVTKKQNTALETAQMIEIFKLNPTVATMKALAEQFDRGYMTVKYRLNKASYFAIDTRTNN